MTECGGGLRIRERFYFFRRVSPLGTTLVTLIKKVKKILDKAFKYCILIKEFEGKSF